MAHERRLAREIIARLNAEFADRIVLDPYFWEYEPFDFSKSFQEQIPNTAAFDVVLCLLWSRLGSRLGTSQKLPDGSPANSGTEYEITHALAAQKERHGLPELHVWINKTTPSFEPEPPEVFDERISQWRALKSFLERSTKNSTDGSFVGSFTTYKTVAEFQELFEIKLRKIAERQAAVSPGTLVPPPKPAWTDGSPFRGLEPFDFKHASIFFGRTAAISGAIEALRKTQTDKDDPRHFLLVLGASGSGKSSLARAGVLPVLTEPGVIEGVGLWRRAVMKPSDALGDVSLALADAILSETGLPELKSYGITAQSLASNSATIPEEIRSGLRVASEREQARQKAEIETLVRQNENENRVDDAKALRARLADLQPPVARFVLLIDQLEELFATEVSAEKRDIFLKALAALARTNPVVIVATMRSDFFPRLAEFPSLLALADGTGSYHLAAPERMEFGHIIRRPAQAAGLKFDLHPETKQPLDEALRDAALTDPQVLPLLEFALEELYKRQSPRGDGLLRWEDFVSFGGIEGVIATKADEAVAAAGSSGEQALGFVLSALVGFRTDRGETAVPIRRRATPEEIGSSSEAERLVAAMLSARLLVSDTDGAGRQTISVAHEALLTRWPKAVAWFETNQEFLRQRNRVETACALWEKENQDSAYLLPPGKPLADSIWLKNQTGATLAKDVVRFIDASKRYAEEAARRRKRNRLIAITAVAMLIVAALVGGMIAFQQRRESAKRRAQAEAYFQVQQATLHQARGEPRLALKLLQEAYFANPDFTTRSAFLSALMKAPSQLEMSFTNFGAGVQAVQFGTNESLAVAAGGALRFLDLRNFSDAGPAFIPENREAPTITCMARTPGGKWIAQREDGTAITLAPSGSVAQSPVRRAALRFAAISSDGRRMAGADAEEPRKLFLGPVDDPAKGVTVSPFTEDVASLAFSPDGQLAVATANGAIFLISDDGVAKPMRTATEVKVRSLAWRGRDALLAAGDENGNIALIENNGTTHALANAATAIQDLSWSPRGETLAAACADGTVRIFTIPETLEAATPPEVIAAHKGAALSVGWNADGSRLVSGGLDETVCLWRLSTNFGPLVTYDKAVPLHSLAVSANGKRIAAGSEQGDIFAWENESADSAEIWHSGSRVLCLAWDNAQEQLSSGNEAGEIQLWQFSKREPIRSVKSDETNHASDRAIWRTRWSHDGKELAFTSRTGALQIWEPMSQDAPRLIGKMPDAALGLAWSADGAICAAGSTHGEIWFWKSSGSAAPTMKIPTHSTDGHGDSVSSLAFLRSGKILASCGRDGTVRLWDARSGAELAKTLPVGGSLNDLALSEDETNIAAAGRDGYLRVWESGNLTPYLAVPLHEHPVSALSWIGSRIFSASEDGTVRILDLEKTKWNSRAHQIIGMTLSNPSPKTSE